MGTSVRSHWCSSTGSESSLDPPVLPGWAGALRRPSTTTRTRQRRQRRRGRRAAWLSGAHRARRAGRRRPRDRLSSRRRRRPPRGSAGHLKLPTASHRAAEPVIPARATADTKQGRSDGIRVPDRRVCVDLQRLHGAPERAAASGTVLDFSATPCSGATGHRSWGSGNEAKCSCHRHRASRWHATGSASSPLGARHRWQKAC